MEPTARRDARLETGAAPLAPSAADPARAAPARERACRSIVTGLLLAATLVGVPGSGAAQPDAGSGAVEAGRHAWPAEYGSLVPLTVRGHSFRIPERHIRYRPPSRAPQDGFVLRFRLSDFAAPTRGTADEFHWDFVAGRAVQVMFAGYLDPDDTTTLKRIRGRIWLLYGHESFDVFGPPAEDSFGLRPPLEPPSKPSAFDILLGELPTGEPVLVECFRPDPFGTGQRCRYITDWRGVPIRISTILPLRADWRDMVQATLRFFDRLAQ